MRREQQNPQETDSSPNRARNDLRYNDSSHCAELRAVFATRSLPVPDPDLGPSRPLVPPLDTAAVDSVSAART